MSREMGGGTLLVVSSPWDSSDCLLHIKGGFIFLYPSLQLFLPGTPFLHPSSQSICGRWKDWKPDEGFSAAWSSLTWVKPSPLA